MLNFSKLNIIKYAILSLFPWFTYKYLYDIYRKQHRLYEEELLFQKRHNCVVMYSKDKGHSGWPRHNEPIDVGLLDMEILYAPFQYFINTSKRSLDVAIMNISIKPIINSLIQAQRNGIKVRVISNFDRYMGVADFYKKMMEAGILVLFYVSNDRSDSLMHTKFMVKDFDEVEGGYVAVGSFNMTYSALCSNYEDVVFSSSRTIVEDYHKNFEKMWLSIHIDNKNPFNHIVLENAGYPN